MSAARPVTSTASAWTAPAGAAALIFDCDGTLADTMPSHFVAWSEMVAVHGIAFTEQRFYELGGVPSNRIIAILSDESGVPVDDIPSMVAHKEHLYVQSIGAVRRIDEVCDVAERHHGLLSMAVASGGMRAIVAQTLAAIGIDHLFDDLKSILQTEDVAVVIDATHLCVSSRGIKDVQSSTLTAEYGGKFLEADTRNEFLKFIN